MDDSSILAAVRKYLSRGWGLVPLHAVVDGRCTCGNPDGRDDHDWKQGGKHPLHGKWQAEVQRIDHLWRDRAANGAFPLPNIGIATGQPSGFWVLDYDPQNAEPEAIIIVNRLYQEDIRPHVQTGGNGLHWRFSMPDFDVTNRQGGTGRRIPAGLDIRGTGGQVVAPPSVSGKGIYVELPTPTGGAPYEAPGWLLDMVRPAAPRGSDGPPAGWLGQGHLADLSGPADHGDRAQRYAAGAVPALLGAYAALDDGRRGEAAWATCVRLVELANLAGWDLEATGWLWADAAGRARANAPGGLSDAEARRTWARAVQAVAGRPAELDPRDVLPPLPDGGSPPFAGAPGVPPPDGAQLVTPGPDPGADRWHAEVQREVNRLLVRDEARRRLDALTLGDREQARARLRAQLLDGNAFMARPPLAPLVDGLLYRNTLARINGPSGHGKTFIVLDLALRVARGLPFAGRTTHPGPVVVLVGEGDEGAAGRVRAWRDRFGELGDVRFLPRPVQAAGPEWDLLIEVLAEHPPALIIPDTQARHSVGVDENDARAMGEFVAALDRLRVATGACVLLVHHSGRTGTHGRGSTAVTGALHTELAVRKEGDAITLSVGKDKDGAPAPDMIFDLTPVVAGGGPVEIGVPAPVVAVWRDGTVPVVEAPRESSRLTRARRLWNLIHDRYNPGMGGTQAEIRAGFAAVAFPGIPGTTDVLRKAWSRAWSDLIQRGLLAQAHGAARFKVVVLDDQSADGVLTPNLVDGKLISEGPTGFDVIVTDPEV